MAESALSSRNNVQHCSIRHPSHVVHACTTPSFSLISHHEHAITTLTIHDKKNMQCPAISPRILILQRRYMPHILSDSTAARTSGSSEWCPMLRHKTHR